MPTPRRCGTPFDIPAFQSRDAFLNGCPVSISDLEAAGPTAAAGLLELAALGADIGRGGGARHARGAAEVAQGLPTLRAAQQHGALAQRTAHGQRVEGQTLPAGLEDPGTGRPL